MINPAEPRKSGRRGRGAAERSAAAGKRFPEDGRSQTRPTFILGLLHDPEEAEIKHLLTDLAQAPMTLVVIDVGPLGALVLQQQNDGELRKDLESQKPAFKKAAF